jgi:hypothetical protein
VAICVKKKRAVPGAEDPRWPFAGLLALYAVLGCTLLGFNRSPEQILLTVGACCLLDCALCYLLRGGTLLFPLSACITGLSLALLLNYAHSSPVFLLPVFLAIGSKYVVTFRGRHFFNPSLFGVAVSLLLADRLISPAPAYQWGGSLAVSAFLVMAALCLFVFRVGRTPLILSFLLFYTLQTALRAWIMRWHLPPQTLFVGTLTSAPFFLFTFYMLTDPQTSPPRPRDQVLLALAITLADLGLHKLESLYTFYYAAFFVALARFGYLHLRELLAAGSWKGLRRGRPSLRPAALVAGIGLAGWALVGAEPGAGGGPDPGFRFETVSPGYSGITARLGNTLNEVDPRVRHLSKWILAEGDSVAVGDYDGDGLLDLFAAHPLKAPEDRAILYRNRGHLRFERVPVPVLNPVCRDPARFGLISGPLFVDYDNDGDQDLFLSVGFGKSLLLRNTLKETGKPGFVDATAEAGLDEQTVSLAAQFFDWDRDGRLDLFIANAMAPFLPDYSRPTPLNLFRLPQPEYPGDRRMFHFMHESWYNAANGGRNALYRGMGGGRFRKEDSRAWGMPETHWSLAAGTGDLNHDGWTDLYVASDFGPDDLYLNDHGRRFVRAQGGTLGSIGRDTYKGMNASVGDVDRDGNLDIYVSNVHEPLQAEGSLLWMSRPGTSPFFPAFSDEATQRGVLNEQRFGWGGAMGDVNGDGWLDLLQANGMVDDTPDRRFARCPDYWYVNEKVMRSGPQIHSYADMWGDLRGRCLFGREANRVYLNRGSGSRPQFMDVADRVGWTERTSSRGIALADLDNDGDLDAVVTHPFAPLSLYRNTLNEGVRKPRWIGLRLVGDGVTCSREAVGSTVAVSYRENGRVVRQTREVQTANGFSAQGDRRLLFGLGRFEGPVTVTVAWYGGATVEYRDLGCGRYHTLEQQRP